MSDDDTHVHVLRPLPLFPVVLTTVVLASILLPGLYFNPLGSLSGPSGVVYALCGLGWFALVAQFQSRVVCERDLEAHELRITRLRWPLATTRVVIPFANIRSVNLEQRSAASMVSITQRDGTRVALTHYSTGSSAHAAAYEVLRGWFP